MDFMDESPLERQVTYRHRAGMAIAGPPAGRETDMAQSGCGGGRNGKAHGSDF
jgi:hypothetical protein